MTTSTRLLGRKRFLPLFCTQLFNAFNDNLYKTAMVLFVVYVVYSDPQQEALFSGVASALFILPFFLFSALAGQLADMHDKARIIRTVKLCEIGLMSLGALGLFLAWKPIGPPDLGIMVLLFVLFLTGVQSTFLGPIKYAILPQHLEREEVLAGTGLVEAGTYVAILLGTVLGGFIAEEYTQWAMAGIIVTALIGYCVSRTIPDAPPLGKVEPLDWNVWRSSVNIIRPVLEDRQIFYAIIAISFFWTIGAVLFIQFPPLAKNVLNASSQVASLFLVMFSVGVAIGSVGINALLKGNVSARYAPVSVILMGLCVVVFYLIVRNWEGHWEGQAHSGLLDISTFLAQPLALALLLSLLAIAIAGGFFVVPLYAFLTTRVPASSTARTIAANNIANAGAMVAGSLVSMGLAELGVPISEQVLMSAVMCIISAWLARRLYHAERAEKAA